MHLFAMAGQNCYPENLLCLATHLFESGGIAIARGEPVKVPVVRHILESGIGRQTAVSGRREASASDDSSGYKFLELEARGAEAACSQRIAARSRSVAARAAPVDAAIPLADAHAVARAKPGDQLSYALHRLPFVPSIARRALCGFLESPTQCERYGAKQRARDSNPH